jgi:ketosteroid isomerase-like protein
LSTDVETVRAAYEAWNRADGSFLEYLDPEVEWIPAAQFLEGPVKGIDALKRLLDTFTDAFEEVRWTPVRILEGAQAGEVVAILDTESRGKESGAEVKVRVAHLLRVRGGKVVWGKIYPNADEGLRAAGIEPSP